MDHSTSGKGGRQKDIGTKVSASDILACIKISEVYRVLTGVDVHRVGRDTWRAAATWRGGDGLNVSGDDSRGLWHDFVSDAGGGVLDLVICIRGGNRADALRWVADLAGVPMDDTPLSPEDRERWADERRALERDLPAARYWRRAVVNMTEELLHLLKTALVDPELPQPEVGEIGHVEGLLSSLRRIDGAALVAEYRWWLSRFPGMTAALVRAGKRREEAQRRALLACLRQMAPAAGSMAT